jgi:hypothetical protein
VEKYKNRYINIKTDRMIDKYKNREINGWLDDRLANGL